MPYLPGSSVKGALRTVVAWSASLEKGLAPTGQELGRSSKYAASQWERRVFGRDPNHDLMRALLVDDSPPVDIERLQLTQVAVYSVKGAELAKKGPGFAFSVEALKPGTAVACRLGISDELLSHPALGLGRGRGWIAGLCKLGREMAKETIAREQGFYRQYRMHALTQFYARLEGIASDLAENQMLLQMAWGSGWGAKAISKGLGEGELLPEVRQRYRLGRFGAIFPKSRRLVERGGAAAEPLGWVKVTL